MNFFHGFSLKDERRGATSRKIASSENPPRFISLQPKRFIVKASVLIALKHRVSPLNLFIIHKS